MKLKLPARFGQRNSQWASELLGYNTNPVYSIGGYGCLITSFGCYVEKNPHDVNELLKANNGYQPGTGNFIWSKCTVLGLNQVYQSPYYSDPVTTQGITKMKSLLDEGRPLITHIDFDPKDPDDDQHWLIVYGYDEPEIFYAHDPWTDTDITLDVYGGVRRCVYEWRAYDKILPKDEAINYETLFNDCRIRRDGLWDDRTVISNKLGVENNMEVIIPELDKLIKEEDTLVQKDKQLQEAQTKINELTESLGKINFQHTSLINDYNGLQEKTADYEKKVEDQGKQISELSTAITELKKQITTPVYSGWKRALIKLVQSLPF